MSDAGNDNANDGDRRLEAWLAGSPRAAPSAAFQNRVMRALKTPRGYRRWRQSLRRFLFAAHTLRWNVASVAASAALLLAFGVGWTLYGNVDPRDKSAELVPVRFVLHRTDATGVKLAGDFTGWQARLPLVRQADGSWQVEVKLPPGEYEYAFVADGGQWIQDPAAVRFRNDGFGGRNALLTVPAARQTKYES